MLSKIKFFWTEEPRHWPSKGRKKDLLCLSQSPCFVASFGIFLPRLGTTGDVYMYMYTAKTGFSNSR